MSDCLFSPDAVRSRLVPIPGARNLREMGGYPTGDGRRVRRGMLYRSGHPADIEPEHLEALERLGLRAIVDLRTMEERDAQPFSDRLRSMPDYWSRDYTLSRGDIVRMLRDPETRPDMIRDHVLDSYRRYPEEQKEGIGATFRLLLDGRAPLLVNCTAGKDRTGVVCAILLAALGVEEQVIRRDYALTEQLHAPADPLFKIREDSPFAYLKTIDRAVWVAMMRSETAYIDATFERLHADHGSVEAYLQAVHGIGAADLEMLRDLLLE